MNFPAKRHAEIKIAMAVFAFVVILCINTPSGLLGVRGRALRRYKNSDKAFVDKSFLVCWYTVCSPLANRELMAV